MLKTTTLWKIFLSIPYPHVITFCLVWQHHDVFQTSATASVKKIENRAEKLHTYATFWRHSCQKLAYCKKSRARKISRVVPRERWLFYLFLTLWKLCHVHFYHTKPCCKRLQQTSKSKSCKLLFRWCRCFRAYRSITMEWNVKRIVPCKRWENFLSVTYVFVLTLLLF